MNRVFILVEGQSEEAFVGRVLRPHLDLCNVHIRPTVIVTRRVAAGPNFKGGVSSWAKIEQEIQLLLRDSSVVAVTTLFDYYGLPPDVPGMNSRPSGDAWVQALHVEASIKSAIQDERLRPNLLVHEFESLLFSSPVICGNYLQNKKLASAMEEAVLQCGSPELVNDDPRNAPSKRITAAYPAYAKTLHGPAILEAIGLARIRRDCPHFGGWLTWLESLG